MELALHTARFFANSLRRSLIWNSECVLPEFPAGIFFLVRSAVPIRSLFQELEPGAANVFVIDYIVFYTIM